MDILKKSFAVKVKVRFLLWPSSIISIVLSIVATIFLNIIF